MWIQKQINLKPRPRGFHLIADEIVQQLPELENLKIGIVHLFMLHTSASLTLNENADPTVRQDFEDYFNELVPENKPYFRHTNEGSDDLPAHFKSSLLGNKPDHPYNQWSIEYGRMARDLSWRAPERRRESASCGYFEWRVRTNAINCMDLHVI